MGEVPQAPEVSTYKQTLEERAAMLGEAELLQDVRKDCAALEKQLYDAYRIPSPDVISALKDEQRVRDTLLSIAAKVRPFGLHHSHYQVGAALLGVRQTENPTDNPWVVLADANTKIDAAGQPTKSAKKWCAEQYLMDAAEREDIRILTFAVVAEPRPTPEDPTGFQDDVSRARQITLTPCAMCRARMEAGRERGDEGNAERSKSFIAEAADVVTADARFAVEVPAGPAGHTRFSFQKALPVSDLQRFHERNSASVADIDSDENGYSHTRI